MSLKETSLLEIKGEWKSAGRIDVEVVQAVGYYCYILSVTSNNSWIWPRVCRAADPITKISRVTRTLSTGFLASISPIGEISWDLI